MKIVLIGFSGSGKSTVARIIGPLLGLQVIEMDQLIIKGSGCSSINEIFEKHGETHFRNLESEVAASLKDKSEVVISTGGGIVTNGENQSSLSANSGIIVFLKSSWSTVEARIKSNTDRPLSKKGTEYKKLFESRLPQYEDWADFVISTDNLTPEEVATAVAIKLGS